MVLEELGRRLAGAQHRRDKDYLHVYLVEVYASRVALGQAEVVYGRVHEVAVGLELAELLTIGAIILGKLLVHDVELSRRVSDQ